MNDNWKDLLEFVETKDILEFIEGRFDRFVFIGAREKNSGDDAEEWTYHPHGTSLIDTAGLLRYGEVTVLQRFESHTRSVDY